MKKQGLFELSDKISVKRKDWCHVGGKNTGCNDNKGCPGFGNDPSFFLLSCLFSLSAQQFTILSTLLGLLLLEGLNPYQQNALGQFFMGIGQSMSTAVAQLQLLEVGEDPNADDTDDLTKQITDLKQQVSELRQKLNDFSKLFR